MIEEAIWTRGAEIDLLEIFSRREDLAEGAGERLVTQCGDLLALLRKQPLLGRRWTGNVRKAIIRRTGLGLFYAVESRRLVVIAVLDLRRSQSALAAEIRKRLP